MNNIIKRMSAIFLSAVIILCMLPCVAKAEGCDEGIHEWNAQTGKCECGASCSHDWSDKNGTCRICNLLCSDHEWSNGRCTICGVSCDHYWDSTHKCTTCDYECQHNNGWTYLGPDTEKCKCNVCGYMITHSGGTATCSTQAVCERCGGSYGELDAENHEYSEWEAESELGHKRVTTCLHEITIQGRMHEFDPSTHKCTVCRYECTHPTNPDDCSICGYKKPVAPQTEESQVEESKSEEPKVEEVENQSSVTVTAVPATVPSNDLSSKVVIEKVSSGSPVTVDISKSNAGVVPVSFVESIAKVSNAVVNLKISDSVQLGVTSSTLKGAVAAPIVVKAVEPKLLTAMLPALTLNADIPSDKKLIVMSPVQGATSQNTAAIYQFYGPEMAGKIVTFYAMDATGKFKVLCQSVVYPNGYAAFSVPVTGFVGFAE